MDLVEASLNDLSLLSMCAICWLHPRSLLNDAHSFEENRRCFYGACRSPHKCPYLTRDISSSCAALNRYPSTQADVTVSLSKHQPYFGLCKHGSHPRPNYTHTSPRHPSPKANNTTRTSTRLVPGMRCAGERGALLTPASIPGLDTVIDRELVARRNSDGARGRGHTAVRPLSRHIPRER